MPVSSAQNRQESVENERLHEAESSVVLNSGDPTGLDLARIWKESALHFPTTTAYAVFPSRGGLDPTEGDNFTVSIAFRFFELPPYGARQNLLGKFPRTSAPFPGWALAIERYATSTRPRIYWMGKDGIGGWFTFDKFEFFPRRWYGLTFTHTKQKTILLFIEDLTLVSEMRSSKGVVKSDDLRFGRLVFAGGYRVTKISPPRTDASLILGSHSVQWKSSFIGEILGISISNADLFGDSGKWRGRLARARVLPILFSPERPGHTLIASWSPEGIRSDVALRGDARWQPAW